MLANLYVKPDQPVISYLTDLTGYALSALLPAQLTIASAKLSSAIAPRLTKDILENNGISFTEALARIRQQLPRNATLVGQNIRKDVEWLGLREGVDFEASCALPVSNMTLIARLFLDPSPLWVKCKSPCGAARPVAVDGARTSSIDSSNEPDQG